MLVPESHGELRVGGWVDAELESAGVAAAATAHRGGLAVRGDDRGGEEDLGRNI